MFHLKRPRWALPERAATPESVFRNRRAFLAGGAGLAAIGTTAALTGSLGVMMPEAAAAAGAPASPFEPVPPRNPAFANAGREVTPEEINARYNNFYEFGSHKRIHDAAEALKTEGWTVTVDGMVETPKTFGTDELLAAMPIEERVIRHRCVEAWSMVVPWIGFPLAALLKAVTPLGSARYVRFETFHDPDTATGQRQFWYPWPYVEGLTVAEAGNPLAFMVMGAYGKVLHKPFGAPIRLHLPWKYGFKSIKSITRITLTEERPVGFWEELQAAEYGFWANVNPEVAHPRWSQASERVLGTDERIPTQLFNGYGPEVAHLYDGLEAEHGDRLWR
ncbi:protein-methionine-sulfoxide reductase catalytic subunit MsrP [Paralimibaculum aggregatum]|uniref:Protein-methionine-sulfoxide reductase catalytic subunit MsrP n=1 Tax=Paralimibaculum aggregatum TaxID=3036245 RepID=A0ABQ6LH72_9RHOB|nr:protein-methionine-sulfoxide reductase catalytic subunit MsrP [Limibaculum sp. NKW23]GMG81776.1 protein-methionine-sulfoxide reductase catalytic subunit MsrP [Limibaculum sp. NKW23]